MNKIKFSHKYFKMPEAIQLGLCNKAKLLAVINTHRQDLREDFINYDTTTVNHDKYELPVGRLMVLLLLSSELWTTVRRWTPEKEKYYRSLIGQDFEVVIENEMRIQS